VTVITRGTVTIDGITLSSLTMPADRGGTPDSRESVMRVVVIGGTGLIGSKLVARLGEHGHGAVPASPNSGVDTLTGEGLDVLEGTDVVVDVSNSPSFADEDVLNFFRTSTTNLLTAAAKYDVLNAVREIAGPELFRLTELVAKGLEAKGDPREVVADDRARYFGALLQEKTLVPGADAQLGTVTFEEFLAR
jgi:uncharacterized protein YbjT (DUF2867 family)